MPKFDLFDPPTQKNIRAWLDGAYDQETKNTILELIDRDPKNLIDAFYTDLSFGTAGMRGLMGIGTNRLNIYTIRKATQGLASYLLQSSDCTPSVLIGFDSRHHSQEFAEETARVLAGNGIHVYLLKELRPVPYVSFACRYKHCQAAVMITASHNPAEYNGYKVYWSDGAQVVPPHDTGIIREVELIHDLSQVRLARLDDRSIEYIDETLDLAYLNAIRPLQLQPEENKKNGPDLKIAYTSLHGTGITLAPKALKDWGFTQILFVEKQIVPDGNFPTVQFPNPEYKEALQLGIDLLNRSQSDILLATDPDADRLGVVVMHHGKPTILSGNEVASICVDYLCHKLQTLDRLKPNSAFVTTIVSTELIRTIVLKAQATCFEVLTGFKYIGEKIHEWESGKGDYHFIFGAEESYGYLLGTAARDKDAIVSSCLIAEIALFAKLNNQTLVDLLEKIYRNYGVFREEQLSVNFTPGKEGTEQIHQLMQHLRAHPPKQLSGQTVLLLEDYLHRKRYYPLENKEEPLTLPQSDVLLFRLHDGSRLVIRPSGTEPKLKLYGSVHQPMSGDLPSTIAQCDQQLQQLLANAATELKQP